MMKKVDFALIVYLCGITAVLGQTHRPVTPDATPEAVELLEFLYSMSGEHTLSGQHDYPMSGPYFSRYVYQMTGSRPALVGRDLGFGDPNTLDGINFRQKTVDDLIASHRDGAIVTLMWHAVPPTMREPVSFREGVQSELSDEQWKDLLTPGTKIHERWKSQVDAIAPYLIQLQYAKVPVLWRPYHEMNGGWFWWGGKPGENGYRALYRMLFDRLVHFHGIRNLLWVFNGNEVRGNVGDYREFYPGHDVVDILATDVYRTFKSEDYHQLLDLGEGRPIALGEIGPLPDQDFLREHPKWTWFMIWSDFLLRPERKAVSELYDGEQVITLEELRELRP